MRKAALLLGVTALLFGGATGFALAANTDTQGVTIEVQAINELAAGADVTLTINSATAGQAPDPATATSTLAWTTNSGTNKEITAVLDTALPAGVTLAVEVAVDSGEGTSAGAVSLTDVAADVVTAITSTASGDNTTTFTATASVAVTPQTINRTITWTLQDQV